MTICNRILTTTILATLLLACQAPQAQDGSETTIQSSCSTCGEVEAITALNVKGQARPLAALAGAVLGGVIGHQFGSGSGNDAATAAGAVGGAIAGSEIDRKKNSKTIYQVVVRLGNGERLELEKTAHPGLSVGDEVRINGEHIIPLS